MYEVIGNVNGADVIEGSTWKCKDGVTGKIRLDCSYEYPLMLLDENDSDRRSFTEDGYYHDSGNTSVFDLKELVMNPVGATPEVKQVLYTEDQIREAWVKLSWDDNQCSKLITCMDNTVAKNQDPDYQKYLELKAKFESN